MASLKINGQLHELDADPQMPLLWALRDLLQMTGTKFGCAQGLCGACTIHLNGVAARACMTTVAAAQGMEITTIEGLSVDASHPLQRAWVAHKVPQCGYCQPGQLMSASALLKANPNPTDEQIKQAMAGNLCRCGTYPRIEAAIKSVVDLSLGNKLASENKAAFENKAASGSKVSPGTIVQLFEPSTSGKSSVGGQV